MEFEVIVIGGGPAGTQCAHDLAARKVSVAVLEQGPAQDPAYVPCLMGPKLEAMFGSYPADIIEGECAQYRFISAKDYADVPAAVAGVPHLGHFANKNAIIAHDRQEAIKVGAKYFFNAHVTGVQVLPDKVEIQTASLEVPMVTGKVVALACGIRAVDGNLNQILRVPKPKTTQVVWRSYRLPPISPTRRVNDMGIIWNGKVSLHGYVMYYNTPTGFYIGLLDYNSIPADMSNILREVCTRHKIIAPLLEGAEQTNLFGEEDAQEFPREIIEPTVKDRLLVLGDAAGFVNIYVYEGFYQAKVSGRCAAEAILASREQGQFDARGLAGYKRRWEEQLDQINLRPGRAAAYILYDTGKLDTVANALLKAIKKEQAEGGTKIQNLFLQNMIAPTYSRANDIIWTKAVVGEMGLGDKAVMLPRFLRAAFIK